MTSEGRAGRPRRMGLIVCILAIVAISGAGWFRLRADSSLEPLLPEHSEARETILFFRDSTFADKAILWFRLKGNGSPSDLFAAADATEKGLDPHIIDRVIRPPSQSSAMDEAMGLLDHAGELLNESDFANIQTAITPIALKQRMRELYLELIKPEGSFYPQMIRSDPLGIGSRILARLYALSTGLGYRMQIKDGRFLSADGQQLMLILETSTTATSLASSQALVAHLNELCAAAPPNVQITPICGQIHTEENEALMRRDMRVAGIINAVGFLLLFLSVSRDWRVAAVFLLPVVTAGLTIGFCALVYPKLSTMMIGLTVAMAGSAVDYGIFVYTAVWMGKDPKADLRRILRPLLISHLTTLGVFVAFLFSKIPAYRELGYLTSISLVLSLLAAIFVLPKLLKPKGRIAGLGRGIPLEKWGRKMVPITFVGAILLVAGIVIARKIQFDSNFTRLDGVSAATRKDENDFQKEWARSDADLALLVVNGKTRDEAERSNDEVYRIIAPHFAEGEFTSLSSFWPSAATRRANEARWREFWTPSRIAQLKQDLASAGASYGFSASAFDPFFQSLSAPPPEQPPRLILASIEDQFTARAGDDWQMLSYFEDRPENTNAVRDLLRGRSDAEIVSRGVLSSGFKESAVSETHLLLGISAAFITVSLLVLTRSVVKSLIIMLPVLTGLVAMLAVLEMMSMQLSVVSVIASVIVLALTSDYGVFAAYACEEHETILGQGMASVHLSFITTLIGTGVMIFAHHPALFQVGVSLTSGLVAGYLTAFLVIPGIFYLWHRRLQPGAT